MKKRVFSFLMVICMMFSQVSVMAYAEGSSESVGTETIKTGLCEHHTTHDESCGYVEAVEGSQCTHEHSETCYQTLHCVHEHNEECEFGEKCVHECTVESGCITVYEECQHVHDENCSYVNTVSGSDCGYVCEICNAVKESEQTEQKHELTAVEKVQAMIDALPDADTITAENRTDVEEQLTAIDDGKILLTDEERNLLNFTKYDSAIAALNELDNMGGAEVPIALESGTTKIYIKPITVSEFGVTQAVYCNVYNGYNGGIAEKGLESDSTKCKKDSKTNRYYIDIAERFGQIEEGADYKIIIHTIDSDANRHQTCEITFGIDCLGDTLTITSEKIPYPDDSTKSVNVAEWTKNSDKYGAKAYITSTGMIIGKYFPVNQPKEQIVAKYIADYAVVNAASDDGKVTTEKLENICKRLNVKPDDVLTQYKKDYAEELADPTTYSKIANIETVEKLLDFTRYTVTFDTNGGTLTEGTATTATTDANGKLTSLPTPTRTGYVFLGWYSDETKWDLNKSITEDMTLTAKWECAGHTDENKDHVCDREDCKATISSHIGGTATCKDKAVCEYCEQAYGELDCDNHVGGTEVRNEKAANCSEEGYTGNTHCKGCDKKLSDGKVIPATGHTDENKDHICDVETCKAKLSDHRGGTATCKDKAVCEYCNQSYGEVNADNHTGGTEVRNEKAANCTEEGYTGDTHCKGCDKKLSDGTVIPATGHTDENKDHICDVETCKAKLSDHRGGTATCKDKAVCEYCNQSYGEVNADNHTGGTEVRNEKAANCTEEGYTGNTHCKGCDKKLSDGISVAKIGHNYESKVTKEATTTSTGIKAYTCKNCGYSYEEKIAKLSSQSTYPKTGDETPLVATIVVTLLSAAALIGLVTYKKRGRYSAK